MISSILRSQRIHFIFKRYNTKLALIVRNDIKMTKGKIAAQCAHAAVQCYKEGNACEANKQLIKNWWFNGQPKIVLKVNSVMEMENLRRQSQEARLITVLVHDAGHTQLLPGTATVLGIGPAKNEDINTLVSHLKLL